MSSMGKVAAGVAVLVAANQSMAWVSMAGSRSAEPAVSTATSSLAHVQQPEVASDSAGYTTTAAVGAVAALSVCAAAAAAGRSRASKPAGGANRVVAMEAGGSLKKCPKTGGPICFCNQNKAAPAIGATADKMIKAESKTKTSSAVSCHAKFPGTDVEIDASGVSFPVKAACEVGEAGKSCDGKETATGVSGMITFTQTDAETITVDYEVKGLAPGKHGFHVHEKADFSNGCASAGPHYNPFKRWHGGPADEERHVGDLGNIVAGDDGVAKGSVTDKLIKIFGEYTVVGRSVMIHADEDDLGRGDTQGWPETPPPAAPAQHTKTTGNAGARIACGVIVAA